MTLEITPVDRAEASVWATALEVGRVYAGARWVLVGALMVVLLEREVGTLSGRTTIDVDVVVDVRVTAGGTRAAAQRLQEAGFELADPAHPYRFVRDDERIDLLAPDRLGGRIDLTTIPPAATVTVPGGSRALATARGLDVVVREVGRGTLLVPSLAGAISLKVRAWHARREPRDVDDVARLLALVADVETVRRELKPHERRALRGVGPLSDPGHQVWRARADPEDAQAAFRRLST